MQHIIIGSFRDMRMITVLKRGIDLATWNVTVYCYKYATILSSLCHSVCHFGG